MIALGILLVTCMAGYDSLLYVRNAYVIPPILVFGLLTCAGVMQGRTGVTVTDKKSRWIAGIAGISLLIAVVPMYAIFLAIADGRLSRVIVGVETGPILNIGLVILLILNALLLVYEIYRMLAGHIGFHPGCVLSVTAMYLCAGYRDMLFQMDNPSRVMRILNARTGVYLLEGLLCIAVLLFFRRRLPESWKNSQQQ